MLDNIKRCCNRSRIISTQVVGEHHESPGDCGPLPAERDVWTTKNKKNSLRLFRIVGLGERKGGGLGTFLTCCDIYAL